MLSPFRIPILGERKRILMWYASCFYVCTCFELGIGLERGIFPPKKINLFEAFRSGVSIRRPTQYYNSKPAYLAILTFTLLSVCFFFKIFVFFCFICFYRKPSPDFPQLSHCLPRSVWWVTRNTKIHITFVGAGDFSTKVGSVLSNSLDVVAFAVWESDISELIMPWSG